MKTIKEYGEELEAYYTELTETIKVSKMVSDTINKVAEYFDGDKGQALMYIMLIFLGEEREDEV